MKEISKPRYIRIISVYSHYLLFILLVCFSIQSFGQRLTKTEKAKIMNHCNTYVALKTVFLSDSLNNEVEALVSDSLFNYFLLQRKYYNLMGFQIIPDKQPVVTAQNINVVSPNVQCEMHQSDTLLYTIELQKSDSSYVVIGFNGEPYKTTYEAFFRQQIDSLNVERIKRDTVKNAVLNFIEGLNSYYKNLDTTTLKKSTTELNFKTIALDYAYDTLRGYRRHKTMIIRDIDEPKILNDSIATCHIGTNSGNTTINLRRQSNHWVVVGENGHAPDIESYDNLQLRISKQLAVRFLSQQLDSFYDAAKEYLQYGSYDKLALATSHQVADVLQRVKNHLGKYNKEHLKLYGFYIESHGNNVEFSEDFKKATITAYQVIFTAERKDIWRVTSMDSAKPMTNPVWMTDHFRDYTSALKINIYPWNDDEDSDVIEIISVGEIDTSILNVLAHYKSPPKSSVSYNSLFDQIDSLTRPYNHESKQRTECVFLQFVIELDGSINHIQIASSTNTGYNQPAIEILKALPKWVPGIYYSGPVRSTYVLPIYF